MSASHGGSIALSGYLYQLLAVTGVQVSAGPGEKKAPEEEAFVVFHEWLDEDAAVAAPAEKSVTFVQVKYSENGEAAKISKGELKQIIKRFAAATSLALKKNWDVSGYILLSNRGLSVPSQRLLDDSKPVGEKPAPPKKGKKKTATKTKATLSWPKTQDHVAACLVDLVVPTDEVIGQLKGFAANYGVLDHEFDHAIGQLISKIFTEVAFLRESGLTLKDWVQMLTGDRDAVSLERGDQKANQEGELTNITAHDPDPREHFPRERTKNLFDAYPQYSLFVFLGKGGMGKTASLRDLARKQADRSPGPFIKGKLAIDALAHWATECADVWRNVPVKVEGTIKQAIHRLQKANPDIGPPILFIALDGIDETFEHEAIRDLRNLLEIVKNSYDPFQEVSASDFKLVVTCRDLKELEKHLPHDAADVAPQPSDWFKTITFDPFDADEFRAVVARDAKAFADRLTPEATVSSSHSPLSGGQIEKDEQSVTSARYQYLRDPLVWREFASLEPKQQQDLLDEKGNAAFTLGEKIFDRFSKKAMRRRPDLERDTLFTMMKAAATEMEVIPNPWTRNDWCKKGIATGASTEAQCILIFREACEAGLIDGSPANWSWRNPAIPRYLKNAPV
jgi:hypothetical protein